MTEGQPNQETISGLVNKIIQERVEGDFMSDFIRALSGYFNFGINQRALKSLYLKWEMLTKNGWPPPAILDTKDNRREVKAFGTVLDAIEKIRQTKVCGEKFTTDRFIELLKE
jgi:hypothetical protein